MVNHRAINKPAEPRRTVDLTAPFRCAGRSEEDQMFEAQQRFSFAVTVLLLEEVPKSETSIMPDDRGWAECDNPSGLLNSPAEIDVVSRLAIFRIEPADALERPAVKRHITSGNMLGDGIGEQNMIGTARRRRNARLNPISCRRRDVWSAHSGVVAAHECPNQVVEPIDIRHAVRIGIRQHFAFGGGGPRVAGVT